LGSRVAVWLERPAFMLPVTVQVPVAGLYSSALARAILPVPGPPTARTWPLGSSVAVSNTRGLFMLPVTVHVPAAGLVGELTLA
jgi:hypothetical protein